MKEAKYFKKLPNNKVQCELCPHYCVLAPDEIGKCRGKKNIDGILYAINYGKTVTISLDPIEKKPLYHFYPGKMILSIGCNSCNFCCKFCQNYDISQFEVRTFSLSPKQLLDFCRKYNSDFVAFTYTEPITWFEYVLDASKFLKKNNIKTVMVTNGFINPKPLEALLPHIDAMNIDLKSMEDNFYQNLCGGRLEPVLKSIEIAAKSCHVEITNLIITNENDSKENIEKLVDFVAGINPNIPLHFSKYFPNYLMKNAPTPESSLYKALEIAKKKLNYVYLGNILADNNTRCPKCGSIIIKRGFHAQIFIKNGKCPQCDYKIYGKY